jgi:hypothetical protein
VTNRVATALNLQPGPFLLTVAEPLRLDERGRLEIRNPVLLTDLSSLREEVFQQLVGDYQARLDSGVKTNALELYSSLRSQIASHAVGLGADARLIVAEILSWK